MVEEEQLKLRSSIRRQLGRERAAALRAKAERIVRFRMVDLAWFVTYGTTRAIRDAVPLLEKSRP